jgi:hypothetical protein
MLLIGNHEKKEWEIALFSRLFFFTKFGSLPIKRFLSKQKIFSLFYGEFYLKQMVVKNILKKAVLPQKKKRVQKKGLLFYSYCCC